MLRIEKLYLQGFKSFNDPTEVIFDQHGITAVVGPNGCGKCVDGDTLVTLADGHDVTIRELVESALRDSPGVEAMDDGELTRSNPHGVEILSLNPITFRIEPRAVSAFIKRTTTPHLLHIRTRSGREVVSTPYHPLFTLKNGAIRALKAEELHPGVQVLVPHLVTRNQRTRDFALEGQHKTSDFVPEGQRRLAGGGTTGIERTNPSRPEGTLDNKSAIPPMAIGGWLKSNLQNRRKLPGNPPDGNRGMIKVQPFLRRGLTASGVRRLDLNNPPIAIGGIRGNAPAPCRSDLNHPPIAIGGIWGNAAAPCRSDLNHPPIAIGGIRGNAAAPCRSDLNHPPIAIGGIREDEIVSIEQVEPKDEWVYDLSIAETHNFVAGNIIVHNSNIADGLNWVIGQQSAKSLRGGKMEDVIFQGTRTRQAAGMAEVLLTMLVTETFEIRSQAQPEAEALKQAEESLNHAAAAVDAVSEAITPAEPEAPTIEGQEASPQLADAGQPGVAETDKPFKKQRQFKKMPPSATRNLFQAGERITVGRRLFRTGESEYEMNGRICRLRDIQELFAGTGLGGAHYAIIEQGRIGQVLSAKPLDRRALIEEAAGISKFKMRQHAAELKLEASKSNLSRLTDIIAEIERQQNSLKRQAQRAKRYKRLRQEMRDLMRAVYVVDYRTINRTLDDLGAALGEISTRESRMIASIGEGEARQNEAMQRSRTAEEALNEVRQDTASTDLETERARQQQTYLTDQLQSLGLRSEQFARNQATIAERNQLISQETARLREDLQRIENEINIESKTLSEEEDRHRQQLQRDAEAERELEEARKRVVECVTQLERWKQLQRQFTDSSERSASRLNGLGAERERAQVQAQNAQEQHTRLSEEVEITASRQQQTALRLSETVEELNVARRVRDERQTRLAGIQRELTAAEQRLKSLTQIDERRTYFSEAVQALMKYAQSGANGFKTMGTLADFVHVQPEHEAMVETALRDELQYVVVPSFEDALRAIDFLKVEGAGRATFLVLDDQRTANDPVAAAIEQNPAGDPASGPVAATSAPDELGPANEPIAEAAAPQPEVPVDFPAFDSLSTYSGVPALPDAISFPDVTSQIDHPVESSPVGTPSSPNQSAPFGWPDDSLTRYQTQHPHTEPPTATEIIPTAIEVLPPYHQTRYQTLDSILGLGAAHSAAFQLALPALAHAAVVDDAFQAVRSSASSNGSGPHVSVTRGGERVIAGRLVTGGSASEKGIGVLGLKREIGELGGRLDTLSGEVRAGEAQLNETRSRITQLEEARQRLDGELRQAEKLLAVQREQLQQCQRERARAATHIRVIEQETEQAETERQEFEAKLRHATGQTAEAERSHAEAEGVVATVQSRIAELRRNAEIRNQDLSRRRADFAGKTERRRGLLNDLRRLDSESGDLEGRLNRTRMESLEASEQSESTRATLVNLAEQLQRLIAEQRRLAFDLELRSDALNAAREKVEQIDLELRAAREAAAQAREERAQREIEKARLSSDLEHIVAQCHAELGENIADVCERLEATKVEGETQMPASFPAKPARVADDVSDDDSEEADDAIEPEREVVFWHVPEDFDLEAAKVRLDALRSKIDALGPVNMMALEELTEVEERFIFLSGQRADIEKAIADTQAAITEIKKRSKERFVEAFHAINENFKQMFVELFGGGQGEMKLIDETDVLESGLEIIAQPPGKRLQNVLLLSGGEKAMSALALVMAIFRYRPSPFCLLDEVDAPLDEVNIGRFAEKVIEMSADTQFMIITHSRRTMEAANTLYGVTMEDPGVSKLISVKLT